MENVAEDLISRWRYAGKHQLKIYPEDDDIFSSSSNIGTGDHKFHLDFIPKPILGNINEAKIFILMANPGYCIEDEYYENDPEFQQYLWNNLCQENLESVKYPVYFFDPKWEGHPGYKYWNKRFRFLIDPDNLIKEYAEEEIRKCASHHIAIIQYIPYHSRKFGCPIILTSTQDVVKFVNDTLKYKVENDDAIIIVVRKAKEWGLEEDPQKILIMNRWYAFIGLFNPEAKKVIRDKIEKILQR